jgi:hypothetical protein
VLRKVLPGLSHGWTAAQHRPGIEKCVFPTPGICRAIAALPLHCLIKIEESVVESGVTSFWVIVVVKVE